MSPTAVEAAVSAAEIVVAGRTGRPKIENLSVFHESAVPRTAGHNRGTISADASGPDARKSDDEPHLG